jgi:hypothetical protein
MNNTQVKFCQITWSAWHSGLPSGLWTPVGQSASDNDYESFVEEIGLLYEPMLSEFLTTHPPLSKEFLIDLENDSRQVKHVMTSQRLWMYDKKQRDFVLINFSEVAQIKSSTGWDSFKVSIHFKDGREQQYDKVASVPRDQAIAIVIEKCSSQDGWNIDVSSAQQQSDPQKNNNELNKNVNAAGNNFNPFVKFLSFARLTFPSLAVVWILWGMKNGLTFGESIRKLFVEIPSSVINGKPFPFFIFMGANALIMYGLWISRKKS